MFDLGRALRSTVRHNGPRTAILDVAANYSWREFGGRVARLAGALRTLGLAPGERFAILSRNGFRVAELIWAGFWGGIIPVPVNVRLAPPEIAQILTDSVCAHLFIEEPLTGLLTHESFSAWNGHAIRFGEASGAAAESYEALIAASAPIHPEASDPAADAILLYTGGTTGRSKGVRLSHANILANAMAFGLGVGARRDDVYLHGAPMFHSADLLATAWMLLGGAHCFLPQFSPPAFCETVKRFGVTATVTVPTMLITLLSSPQFDPADLASLRLLIYGAAPMAVEWIQRVAQALPHVDFCNSYGLTETSPDLTIFAPREFRAAIDHSLATGDRSGPLTSVGKPNLLNLVRVVDPEGHEVPAGAAGELIAQGPNIMIGYLDRPEETAAALRKGWLHTGDIARIDEQGYVYLLDRLKDMVISGGENVFSGEVEAVLHRHPAVAEAAVIGASDERLGETVLAVIVARTGASPHSDDLTAFCRRHLGGFKVPRRVVFVEQLPKSALGKILKSELRKTYGREPRT
jgi:long-chain acyl-CoA synthetase